MHARAVCQYDRANKGKKLAFVCKTKSQYKRSSSTSQSVVSHANCSCLKQEDHGLPCQLQLSQARGPRSPRPTVSSKRTKVSQTNCCCIKQEDQGLPDQLQLSQARGPRSPRPTAAVSSKRTKVSQANCIKQEDQRLPDQL